MTPVLHAVVSALHGYCKFTGHGMLLYTDHCYYMYMLHRYYDTSHSLIWYSCPTDIYMHHFTDTRYTDITATYAHRTSVHACVISIFLSYGSPCILPVLLFHVPVFLLYACFLLLIWIFPLLDLRAVDMRYVEFHIYCSRYIVPVILFPFPVILFPLYCSILSTELRSSYHVTRIMYLFLLHCILDISAHKVNWGMGET